MARGWGHGTALIVWLGISAVIYYVVDSHQKPVVATLKDADRATGEIVIPRSRDGHYYVEGTINNHPIIFMIDTGASVVTVGERAARAADLPKGAVARFRTAGGEVMGEMLTGIAVEAAGIRVEELRVAIGPDLGPGNVALLGQNFLRRIEVTQGDDRMVLRVKGS